MTHSNPFRAGRASALLLPLLLLPLAGCDDDDPVDPPPVSTLECTSETDSGICLAAVTDDVSYPLQLEQPAGDDRIFVAEQGGRIGIIRNDALVQTPFLDITDRAVLAPEQGLIGMAFHPDFDSNGHVFVNYTDQDGIHVERYTVGADPDQLDEATRKEILFMAREAGRHSGGQLTFGPDGMLWIAVGDQQDSWLAQDSTSLFGSLLRIDVDGGDPYAIPADNPFVGDPEARGEIWATGLRNPWRFSFESGGRLFLTDVGEQAREELNIVAIDEPGHDFAWPHMEGTACYQTNPCDPEAYTMPAFEYDHPTGSAILGGTIYQRDDLPALEGRYVFGDFSGWIGSIDVSGEEPTDLQTLELGELGALTSLGVDADGRHYVMWYERGASGGPGVVARIQPTDEDD